MGRVVYPQDDKSPAEIVARARKGSQAAREELLRRYQEPLRAYLHGQIGPRLSRAVSISDISQESLLRSIDALRLLPSDASLADYEALLYRHARWLVLKEVRKLRRFEGESALDGPLDETARSGDGERREGPVTLQDEREWLQRAVGELDELSARIVRLRLEGLTFAAIGHEVALGEDAVRKRYLRTAMRLRRSAHP